MRNLVTLLTDYLMIVAQRKAGDETELAGRFLAAFLTWSGAEIALKALLGDEFMRSRIAQLTDYVQPTKPSG